MSGAAGRGADAEGRGDDPRDGGRGGGLAGVVVAYRPSPAMVENLASYRDALEFLAIVDNSPARNPFLERLADGRSCAYLWDGSNRGMATALNLGASAALERGCAWLLTMDQDSRFAPGALDRMLAFVRGRDGVGVVSPWHRLDAAEPPPGAGWEEIRVAMTSGNLLNLEAYRVAGPFLDKLFIDYVDYEYCLRLKRRGYRNFRVNEAVLVHSLGGLRRRRFLAWDFRPTHHGPERRYYMARNRLHVMRAYPSQAPAEAWAWAKELVKLCLFEDGRARKLAFMARGAGDFLAGRYGPLRGEGSGSPDTPP